jgi:hypothetical protein
LSQVIQNIDLATGTFSLTSLSSSSTYTGSYTAPVGFVADSSHSILGIYNINSPFGVTIISFGVNL